MAAHALIGTSLGGYAIESKIGSGATGIVFRALHEEDQRPVALKVLHDNLGSISGLERRYSREARALKKLAHPNIVEVLGFSVEEGRTFIVMELLEGITLEQSLEHAPLPAATALGCIDAILEALAIAHEHEIVHRDLKPANVFLTKDGGVKLLDFGLAKMLSIDELSQEGTLTRRGRIVGTPAYMAPEQITGVFTDVRADVYALGVMLYELLADRRPFLYERRSELLRAHLLEPVPPITSARGGLWIHPELDALIMKALAKDPADRFAHGRAMMDAFRALPRDAVRLEPQSGDRSDERKRVGTSSAVISEGERKAITESVGFAANGAIAAPSVVLPSGTVPEPMLDRPAPRAAQRDRETEPPSAEAGRGLSTSLLVMIAILLFTAAGALWAALMVLR